MLALSRFAYLIAGICALYVSLAPYFSRWHGSPSLVTLGYWVCACFLLVAATLKPGKHSNALGLISSPFVVTMLAYGVAFQSSAFDRVNQALNKPVAVTLLISSLASLIISVVITRRSHEQ